MPGTAINNINYANKSNQQNANEIDGILNEVNQIDNSSGGNSGQYNAGSTKPVVQVNSVPKQFQYDPTPPVQVPSQGQQMPPPQQYQQPQMQQMEAFQGGSMFGQSESNSFEWMRSLKLTLIMMLLLTLLFNPFTIRLWKNIPVIEQFPMIAKLISGLIFCLSFYVISLFI